MLVTAYLLLSVSAGQGTHLTSYLQDIKYDVKGHKQRLFNEMSKNKCPELRAGIEAINSKFE